MKEADFKRKKLNLVVVMDISGSMGSSFDQYYYDRFGNKVELKGEEAGQSKIQIASKSVNSMLDHLQADDRFGLVLFDDSAYLAKPLSKIGVTDMAKLKKHISDLSEQGSTNMQAGLEKGTELFGEMAGADPDQYENRIVFVTDAMPNTGGTDEQDLLKLFSDNAGQKINSTFIGVGVDFNTELVDGLAKIRGANYYSVHSAKEFQKVLDEEFDYMVTPLVFDLQLNLAAQGYDIEKVYGSPEANEATGEIMKINTLFPSKTEDGQTKGGVVLLKLNKLAAKEGPQDSQLTLTVSYEDRNGQKATDEKKIVFAEKGQDYFDNSGIEKAILLTRYVSLMKDWLIDEIRFSDKSIDIPCPPIIAYDTGIRCPEYRCMPPMPRRCEITLGKWERQSTPLKVDQQYQTFFKDFASYFAAEMKVVGDESLSQELDILKVLSK